VTRDGGGPGTTPRILASASPGEVRVVLLRGDDPVEVWVERPARPDGVGDLHRARVQAIAPAMAAAFVALAGGETGLLPETEAPGEERRPIARAVQVGLVLPVRVTRAAQGGKGPRVTARLTAQEAALAAAAPPGNAPRLLARGPGAVLRLARAHRAAPVATDTPALAAAVRAALGADRVALVPAPAFDDALEAELEALSGPEAPLPGGGRILVHPTPALTAIDVDAGAVAGGRDPAAQRRLNEAAVAEAARQIRLRNLAGPILLDLAGLSARGRGALEAPLRAALGGDPLAQLKGLGPLGLFEILRRRVHPPLHEVLGGAMAPLTHGLAALCRAAREAAAAPGRAFALRAAPAVLEALRREPGALEAYAAGAGRPLELRLDLALSPGREAIEEAGGGHGGR
jgi:ribonuclease G